eukprot:CAMPEP_0194109658 /NCGR_PEP_ID=MMETSP0150-20130528/9097_1 /TAXON_ID=122233 /ORGANISM="Chaetoceros debilis, Strain MM31A-1" /LENGTH=863 /DNA_ID=CAMNT_0038798661 /DNA_START=311 /DNA_END=2902 /DNA_ORIENTATION=+
MRFIFGALVGSAVLDYSFALTFHSSDGEHGDVRSFTHLIDGSKCFFDGFDEDSCLALTFPSTYLKDYGGSLVGDGCMPPIVHEADIRNSLDEANGICRMFGQYEAPFVIDTLVESIMDNVSNETCQESMCVSTMIDTMSDTVDFVTDLVFGSIVPCAGVELDSDSCIVATTIDMILSNPITKVDDLRRLLSLGEEAFTDEDLSCIPPTVNTTEIGNVIRIAEGSCQEKGEDFSSGSSSDIESALNKLFSSRSCWVDTCASFTGKVDNATSQAGEAAKTLALDLIANCASVQLDRTSCVQNEMVTMLFNSRLEPQYPDSRELKVRNEPQLQRKRRSVDQLYGEFGNSIRNLVEEVEGTDANVVEKCVAPFHVSNLQSMIDSAMGLCDAKNVSISNEERTEAHGVFSTLLEEDYCWESICSDDPLFYLMTNTLESCLGFVLPETLTHANRRISSPTPEVLQDQRLACMIDYVMSTDPIEFGLDRPSNKEAMCFPPGYQTMRDVCSVSLGPIAMENCPLRTSFPEFPSVAPDMSFSYSYDDFSMSYDYMQQVGSGDQEDSVSLVDDFCSILERMSSPEGQKCLQPLCFDGKALNFTHVWNSKMPQTTGPSPSDENTGDPVPSDMVTANPSPAPSEFIPPTLMIVKFEASITIKLDDELPEDDIELRKIAYILEEGLSEFLPENAEVTVTKINGIKVPRRRLAQGGVEIEFEVVISSPCENISCSGEEPASKAESLYVVATEDLKQAVSGGTLAATIKQGALEEGVAILQNMVPSLFEAEIFTAEMVTKSTHTASSSPSAQNNDDDDDDDDDDNDEVDDNDGYDDDDDGDDDDDDSKGSLDDSSAGTHAFPCTIFVWVFIVGSFVLV